MSKLASEYARVQLRAATSRAELMPKRNENAITAMDNIIKVQSFIEPIARLSKTQGVHVKYWSPLHVPFFHSMYSTVSALVNNTSLAQARGDGRMSTIVDNTRSIGNGLRKKADGVITFLELEGVEWDVVKLNGNAVSFPVFAELVKSGHIFEDLKVKLESRANAVAYVNGLKGVQLTASTRQRLKQEKDFYLIKNAWTRSRIEEACIEFLGRAFAYAMPAQVREDLVLGQGMTFGKALDKLQLKSTY